MVKEVEIVIHHLNGVSLLDEIEAIVKQRGDTLPNKEYNMGLHTAIGDNSVLTMRAAECYPFPFSIVFYGAGIPKEGMTFQIWSIAEMQSIIDSYHIAIERGAKIVQFSYDNYNAKAGLALDGLVGFRCDIPDGAALQYPLLDTPIATATSEYRESLKNPNTSTPASEPE